MPTFLQLLWATLRSPICSQAALNLEILALRQQLAIYQRERPKPRLTRTDRLFWVILSQVWSGWREALIVVRPETVIRWHQQGFRLFWRWKSRSTGRPRTDRELRKLIRNIALSNPSWGAPRVHGELLKLGIDVAESTVSLYMPRRRRPPSSTWKTFLHAHLPESVGVDFFTIPTATFRVLFGFVVLSHDRRRILHMNVTEHPTAEWAAQQIVEAVGWDALPRYLFRDRDFIYGDLFRKRVAGLGIDEILSAPRSPWQNPYAERVIGSIRQDLLDHVIVLGERHALRLLRAYQAYYNGSRTHLSLKKDAPDGREVQSADRGARIVARPEVFGLHHRYERVAA